MNERRLSAIMFTDVVGFSALSHRNEALALELLDEHFQQLRPIIPQHSGREIKTIGDSFMVEFASPLQAVRCAIAMQQALRARNATLAHERHINIRIGIHLGDVEHRGGDVFGDGVNIAARLEPLAEPGGICLSRQVYDHIHTKLDAPLVSLGTPPLKNIPTPVEVYRVVLPWQAGGGSPLPAPAASPPAPAPADRRSIAVLPLANMSPDPENEYFSDGLTEDILTHLSRIGRLKVISRTSVMQYKKTTKNLREIGRELGVATILEGSVRKAANKVRITVQLLDAHTDQHLWAETYDRELTDIFAIQSDVARQIAEALKARVSPEEQARIDRAPTANLEAYQVYLRGLYLWNRRTDESVKAAIACFEQAIALDPRYAQAYVGLADAYIVLNNSGAYRADETYLKAKTAALAALAIDETLGEAHAALGQVKMNYDRDWAAAEESYRTALRLNPGHANAHHWYALFLMFVGRLEDAAREIERAQELDPLSFMISSNACMILFFARRYDRAIEGIQKIITLEPRFAMGHLYLGLYLLVAGVPDKAEAALLRARELLGGPDAMADNLLALAYVRLGDRGRAQEILDVMLERRRHAYFSPVAIASVYLWLGERADAFSWFARAVDERDGWVRMLKVNPLYDEVKSDPAYVALMRQIGLEH